MSIAPREATPGPVVRPMEAADLAEVTRIHMAAFPGYMNVRLGSSYVRKMLEWFRSTPGGIALVAGIGGRAEGYVVGCPSDRTRRMTRDLLSTAFAALCCRPWLLLSPRILATAASRCLSLIRGGMPGTPGTRNPARAPVLDLVSIAVAPSAVGCGVGTALMTSFAAAGAAAGNLRSELSVYPDNHAAQRLYERCGWTRIDDVSHKRVLRYGVELRSTGSHGEKTAR